MKYDLMIEKFMKYMRGESVDDLGEGASHGGPHKNQQKMCMKKVRRAKKMEPSVDLTCQYKW